LPQDSHLQETEDIVCPSLPGWAGTCRAGGRGQMCWQCPRAAAETPQSEVLIPGRACPQCPIVPRGTKCSRRLQAEPGRGATALTLGEAWAQLKKSLADEAEVHLKFSSKLQSEVEKPLLNFRENFKKDMKKCDHHIADLRKHLASRYTAVEKARKALTERQKDLEMKTQQLEVKLSNKTEEEIKKARRKSTQAGDDLMRCVDLYNQAQSKWFEEMVTTTLELERLEVERVEMIRQHLCQYTQLRHETDMFNQSTVELVDQLLRKVDPAKDRELWVKEHKTGDIRPVDMEI
uniref:Growth arrest specific 7 n=1 Tax=Serinus canaria TaxID=9135 RepID=A0A8C9MJL1_SERCA